MFDSDVFSRLKKLPTLSVCAQKSSSYGRGRTNGAGNSFDAHQALKMENVDEFESVHHWLEFHSLRETVGRADRRNTFLEKTIEKFHEREKRGARRVKANSKMYRRYDF